MIFVYNILYIHNNLLERNIGVFLSPQITNYLRGNNENNLLFSISSTFSRFNYLREKKKKRKNIMYECSFLFLSIFYALQSIEGFIGLSIQPCSRLYPESCKK